MNLVASAKSDTGVPGGGTSQMLEIVQVDDAVVWDALLDSHPQGSAQSSAGWSVYKERIGHEVKRLTVVDAQGNIVAMALSARRSLLGVRVSHIAAGPLLFTDSVTLGTQALKALLGALAPTIRDIVAVEPLLFGTPVLTQVVLSAGMTPVLAPGQHTLVVDLSDSEEALRKRMSRNWRRGLRQAEDNPDLTTDFASEPETRAEALDVFERLYGELRERKGFQSSFSPSAAHDIFRDDPRYVILVVRERDAPIAVYISHASGDSLTSFVSASSEAARKNYANHLGHWRLITYAKAKGLRTFDCGGIDPAGNPGVYQFKAGLADDAVQTGPIWVHANSRVTRALATMALARR